MVNGGEEEDLLGAKARIAEAAADVADRRLALQAALDLRDAAIIEGIDLFHLSHRQAAQAAGVSLPRIEAVLASGHPSERRRRYEAAE